MAILISAVVNISCAEDIFFPRKCQQVKTHLKWPAQGCSSGGYHWFGWPPAHPKQCHTGWHEHMLRHRLGLRSLSVGSPTLKENELHLFINCNIQQQYPLSAWFLSLHFVAQTSNSHPQEPECCCFHSSYLIGTGLYVGCQVNVINCLGQKTAALWVLPEDWSWEQLAQIGLLSCPFVAAECCTFGTLCWWKKKIYVPQWNDFKWVPT